MASEQAPQPSEANCTYCGRPIRWRPHEVYKEAFRSIDFDTEKDHECDPSEMLTTILMRKCKNCGKLVESMEGKRYDLYFYPPYAVEHKCRRTEE